MPDAAGQSFEKPHMRTWTGQFNMSQPLAPHLRQGHFDAALVADNSAVLHAFVLAAKTLPVCYRPENLGAKQTITLRLEGPIVDGFGFGDLSMRPGANLLRRCQTNFDTVKISSHTGAVIRVLSKQG